MGKTYTIHTKTGEYGYDKYWYGMTGTSALDCLTKFLHSTIKRMRVIQKGIDHAVAEDDDSNIMCSWVNTYECY